MSRYVSFQELPAAVLRHICDCLMSLATSEGDRVYRKTLVCLAHTCRATHGPAADTIWQAIPSLAVLMLTLPENCWRKEPPPSPGSPSVLCLTAKFFVSAQSCARLLHYASRVRKVNERHSLLVIEPASLDALQDRVPQLLPTIRVFRTSELPVSADEQGKPRSFHQLFGRQLRILDYRPSSDAEGQYPYNRAAEGLRMTIPYLRTLTVLRTGALPLSMENMAQLGTLLRLETLDASVIAGNSSVFDPAASILIQSEKFSFFPVLREFALRLVDGLSLFVPITFLRFSHSRVLQTIKIETQSCFRADDIQEFLSIVGKQRSGGLIKTLSLTEPPLSDERLGDLCLKSGNIPNTRGRGSGTLNKDTFEPLLKLTGLESLTLRWSTPTNITDSLLASMAASWPDIRVLRLHEVCSIGAGGVTHKGLLSLAAKCTKLEDLGVEVKLRDCVAPSCVDAVSKGRHKPKRVVQDALTRFHVGKSKIEDPDAVALFLSRVFPHLEPVDCWWWMALAENCSEDVRQDLETNRSNWEEVDSLLRAFATVRKEKRD
ncbi:hypothetical protein OH76DRAFT_1399332 [Lentinus brumalis]|uniref:F-box domain-containing protein n=1 Tax=Lentinus brumalis TaxID=2498619 RepID=A0A371DLL4_9APHY|nr:hypothetical protein OH76DRAFT_1399332 [Polyporus brumalis]